MTSRLELRTALRRRLEDTGTSPLWDDATLNEFLAGPGHRYGAMFPRELVTTLAVEVGVTSGPVPEPAIEGARIVRVLDETGTVVPRGRDDVEDGEPAAGVVTRGQAWRWWDGTLLLQRPASRAGSWRIEHLGGRPLPADDLTQVDVIPGDEGIVVALAAAAALRRRSVEEGKRGGAGGTIAMAADTAEREADRLAANRRRRTRGGWLTPG